MKTCSICGCSSHMDDISYLGPEKGSGNRALGPRTITVCDNCNSLNKLKFWSLAAMSAMWAFASAGNFYYEHMWAGIIFGIVATIPMAGTFCAYKKIY